MNHLLFVSLFILFNFNNVDDVKLFKGIQKPTSEQLEFYETKIEPTIVEFYNSKPDDISIINRKFLSSYLNRVDIVENNYLYYVVSSYVITYEDEALKIIFICSRMEWILFKVPIGKNMFEEYKGMQDITVDCKYKPLTGKRI